MTESGIIMYGAFVLGYSIFGLPIPKKMRKVILFLMVVFIGVDLITFDYSSLSEIKNYLPLTILPLLLLLFGIFLYREFNPKIDAQIRNTKEADGLPRGKTG